MAEIVLAVLNAATLIMVAVIQTSNNKSKKLDEERYQRRLHHEELTMKLMQCTVRMSMLSAKKMAGEHINGDLEKAINSTEESYYEYVDFVSKECAAAVIKN